MQASGFGLVSRLNSRLVFHLTFFSLCMWEGRAIEQLGGHLVYSQGQPITETKSIRWRDFRKIVEIEFLDNVDCSEQCHIFSFGSKTQKPFMQDVGFP